MTQPSDSTLCVGRPALDAHTPCCERRDACRRYADLISRPADEPVQVRVDLHLCVDDTFAAHLPLLAAQGV